MLYSHIFSLVLLVLSCTLAEEKKAEGRIDDFLSPPGTIHQNEEPSYLSRFTSWLFPYSKDDNIPSTSELKIAQPRLNYREPNPSSHDKNCNLCNKEPWIPVVSNYGSKTMIGFVQPSEIKQPGSLYGAPEGNIQGEINSQYGVPSAPPQQQYGPPQHQQFEPPSQYGSPQHSQFELPLQQYGPPPAQNFEPPAPQYGAPHIPQYGPPPIKYGPPKPPIKPPPRPLPPPKYGPPKYIPKPPIKYGPPIIPGLLPPRNPPRGFSLNPLPPKYGPPPFPGPPPPNYRPPPSNYGPPLKNAPISNYGPPKFPPSIPGPHSEYGPPVQPHKEYGPPHFPNIKPVPHSEYGSPNIGLEQPNAPIPHKEYGPPSVGPTFVPHAEYGPPNSGPSSIQPQFPLAPQTEYGSSNLPSSSGLNILPIEPAINAPISNYGVPPAPVHEKPEGLSLPSGPSAISNFGSSIEFRSPSVNYQPPPNNPAFNYGAPNIPNQNQIESQKGLTDSYGPPPSGPITNQNQLKPTNEEYLPPAAAAHLPITGHQENNEATNIAPSAQGSILQPIPFPNLSSEFIAPLHNAQTFQSTSDQVIQDILQNNVKQGIEVVPSVPITDFVSSVQYPTEIIQSPLIDLAKDADKSIQSGNIPPTSFSNQNSISFNAKPIIVDEHHSEATDQHHAVTLQNDTNTFKRDSDNVLGNLQSLEDNKNTTQLSAEPSLQTLLDSDENLSKAIASQLLGQEIQPKPFEATSAPIDQENYEKALRLFNHHAFATNEALFTPPATDNTTWTPVGLTTSIQPPPLQPPSQNTWIQKVKQRQPFTTKNPKQIQIIVPYITENEWNKNGNTNPSTNQPYNPPLSLFMKLPQLEDSQWAKYINVKDSNNNNNPVSNIRDLLKDTEYKIDNPQHLPFDILKLQKNIDVWTEQEYNGGGDNDLVKASTSARFNHSKKIPDEYLTTPFDTSKNEITTELPNLKYYDYLASGSNQHTVETKEHNITSQNKIIESNTIGSTDLDETLPTTTPIISTSTSNVRKNANTWEKIEVSISPVTNERVYVVTPQPWNQEDSTPESAWYKVQQKDILDINDKFSDKFTFTSPRFTKRPEPIKLERNESKNKTVHFVYSDWPKLINNLLSSTPKTFTAPSHPLFGKMELSDITTTENPSTDITETPSIDIKTENPKTDYPIEDVQTLSGHSKVSGTTLPTVSKKKSTGDEKKQNIKTTTEKVL